MALSKLLPRQVNGRIIPKRIHVRVEHVHPSRCKEEFLRRVKTNDEFKHQAKLKGGAYTASYVLCPAEGCFLSRLAGSSVFRRLYLTGAVLVWLRRMAV